MERDFYSHIALDTFNGMRHVNFSPSARANTIRGMLEFSSMTQKFFARLAIDRFSNKAASVTFFITIDGLNFFAREILRRKTTRLC